METGNLAAASGSEPVLRCAISSLQQFLGQFGLVPSKVIMSMDLQDIPFTTSQRKTFIQHERKDDMYLAVQSFMETLMSDELPPHALVSFMQALFDANYNPADPHINDSAWYVHDIITLACTYMPLQQALLDFFGQSQAEGQDVMDMQRVLVDMNNRRLLNPQFTPRIMETLELHGMEAAIVHLLACVYATQIDVLKEKLLAEENAVRENGNGVAIAPDQASDEGSWQWHWVLALVQCFEVHMEQDFRQRVPEAMLSDETLASVYNCLAFGRRGRMGDDADAASDAGDSVASDATLIERREEDEGEEGEEEEEPGVLRKRPLTRDEILAMNLDPDAKMRRTSEYVGGITLCLEIFNHEYQRPDLVPSPAPRELSEQDDNSSVVTGFSDSTENNSHVNEDVDDDDDDDGPGGNFWIVRDRIHTGSSSGEGNISLRAYQEEVLQWAREGQNVAIFLPTGTGKTFIVLKYVQECLSRPGLNRVVFLAPKVKLAEQQYHRFRKYFPKVTYFRCGRSRSSSAPFSELLDTYQVFVMTPQCLVEAIQRKEVQIRDFSLMVLDECHHVGQGKHAYMGLMGLYLDAKFEEGASLKNFPQVIGLTASPGVGSSRTLPMAVFHIKELCYKMNVEKINIVKTNTCELQYHVNEPKHEIHTCRRRKFDGFKKTIELIMEHIENRMLTCAGAETQLNKEEKEIVKAILTAPTSHRGLPQYHGWVSNLDNKLIAFAEYRNMYHQLFSMAELLIIYQKSLILNEDCESSYALEYLRDQVKLLEDQVPSDVDHVGASLERKLLDQFYRHVPTLEKVCNDPEDYNPKLEMLQEIMLEIVEKNGENCACMVFVRTVELTKAIEHWINDDQQLSFLSPGRITGRKKSTNDRGGMTLSDVTDVMEKFRRGEHKMLVCTSAADEGLDFQACNVVVRYDYVTSLISMIQTRGRARTMDSHYCVLGNLTQGNIDKEKGNLAAERLMNQAVNEVMNEIEQNSNAFLADMNQWQRREYKKRRNEDRMATLRVQNKVVTGNIYQLLCRKCQSEACMSTDFRMLDQSSRAVVATHFADKWKRVETGRQVLFRANIEKIAKVHCRNCSYDWGILARYIPTGQELPVLKIESFILKDMRTGNLLKHKLKWSAAPFHVEDISHP